MADEAAYARRALRALDESRFADALAIVEDHRADCPQQRLAAELQSMRVVALCRTHDPDAADSRARFTAAWPSSVAQRRIARACEER